MTESKWVRALKYVLNDHYEVRGGQPAVNAEDLVHNVDVVAKKQFYNRF